MQRRTFILNTGTLAFVTGVFGRITWSTGGFMGDTPTTTDILGPFYRPGAPQREDLNPPNFTGEVLHLFGTVFREDGKTPVPDGLIEAWQCGADGLYDNLSDEYRYRGSQKITTGGNYHFRTAKPVAYPVEENSPLFRPAHIHLRVSATGSQDLITQIYFTGDPHLAEDPSTKSGLAVNRTLTIRKRNRHESEIRFDVVLKKEYLPADVLFHQVAGIYKMNDNSMMEFYRDGDLLFYKTNNQIWGSLFYAGNNSFTGGANDTEARFEFLPQGKTNVYFRFIRRRKTELEGTKVLMYKK